MATISTAFLVSLVISLVLTPLVVLLAQRVGAIDHAGKDERKIHVQTTPRLGGIAIVVAFYAPLIGLLIFGSEVGRYFRADQAQLVGLLLGGVAIAALGVYDDIAGANAIQKLIVQISTGLCLFALGFRIDVISTPFDLTLHLGMLSLPITLIWMVGIINALNLIDGLDGLASGVAFFAAASTFAAAYAGDKILLMLFMACLAGALLGFLVYNFNPARIFMGDTGSMFLGYVLAVASVQSNSKSHATVAMIVPVLALGLPIMDTFLAMLRRLVRGKPMLQADREHLHHRLLAIGHSHRRSVIVLYGMSLVFAGLAIVVALSRGTSAVVALAAAAAVAVAFMRYLAWRERVQEPRATRAAHRVDAGLNAIADASTIEAAWPHVTSAVESLGARSVRVVVPFGTRAQCDGSTALFVWETAKDRGQGPEGSLVRQRDGIEIELTMPEGALIPGEPRRQVEELLDRLLDAVQDQLSRSDRAESANGAVIPLRR